MTGKKPWPINMEVTTLPIVPQPELLKLLPNLVAFSFGEFLLFRLKGKSFKNIVL